MLIKTSKWSVLYYFFNNLCRQLLSIIIFISSIIVGIDSEILVELVLGFTFIKIVRGVFLSKAITIYVDNQSIVVNKKMVIDKQIKISKCDIQSIKTRESFFGRILGVADLDIAITGNVLEEQNIRIKCIAKKDMDSILSFMSEKVKINPDKEWTINKKQIALSSMMSISWTYIFSLVYLREDIKEISNIRFVEKILIMLECFFEQKYEVIAYLEIVVVGVLMAIIVNMFKYYRFRIYSDEGMIHISRGMLDLYKLNINVNDISSFSIRESVFSMIGGYGKLLAEGQSDEDDTLSLTIFPCEKKQKITYYLKNWFNIETNQKYIAKKESKMKFLECVVVLVLSILANVLTFNKLSNKYFILFLVVIIYIGVNIIIKISCSYVSIDENTMILYKAGINSKTIYVKNIDIVSLEVEDNYLQRMFKCENLYVNYISYNEEYSVKLRNYHANQIDEIIRIWGESLKKN